MVTKVLDFEIRATRGSCDYWVKWLGYCSNNIQEMLGNMRSLSGDPSFRPQYLFVIGRECLEYVVRRYSAGLPPEEDHRHFSIMLDVWEESERLAQDVYTPEQQDSRNNWAINLDHYIICFWVVGLALAVDLPEDLWCRLIALIDNEGRDALLDRVISTRNPQRLIGNSLCHPKPFERLFKVLDAPRETQAGLLRAFVEHWYEELNRDGSIEMPATYRRPYWYTLGDVNFEGGAYFGRWCFEAIAVVKAFNVDDSACLGHEHYPGDILRPGEPTTHVNSRAKDAVGAKLWERLGGWFKRH